MLQPGQCGLHMCMMSLCGECCSVCDIWASIAVMFCSNGQVRVLPASQSNSRLLRWLGCTHTSITFVCTSVYHQGQLAQTSMLFHAVAGRLMSRLQKSSYMLHTSQGPPARQMSLKKWLNEQRCTAMGLRSRLSPTWGGVMPSATLLFTRPRYNGLYNA